MKCEKKIIAAGAKKAEQISAYCRAHQKTVALLVLAAVLLSCLEAVSTGERSRHYIEGKDSVGAIRRGNENTGLSLPFQITAEKDGIRTSLDVTLSLNGREKAGSGQTQAEEDPGKAMEKEVRKAVREVESRQEPVIRLPRKLEDGTRLTWKKSGGRAVPAALLLLPLGILFFYQNSREKEKTREKDRVSGILKALPAFNNQLLLLLESGLIFSDAFTMIADGYEAEKRSDPLGKIVEDILRESRETGSSLISIMNRHSKLLRIREFSRLTGIITDNQYKGVNLSEKLEGESDLLWNQRKKLAEERGKAAETKLAFPLAILLLVLIVVTAAPAILQM